MINLSDLLTSIKMDLGIYGLALPFKDPEKTLNDVIRLKSIKTFSQFFPYKIDLPLQLNQLKCIKDHYIESIYELPDAFGSRQIMYVNKVNAKNKLLGNGYLSPLFDGDVDLYDGMMMTQASANLASLAAPAITFKFKAPNLLYLYNLSTMYGEIDIELAIEHIDNLSSIPATMYESFFELASLDIQAFLYNTLKHYNELNTAYGTISLKIDDWSNAKADRKELVERWRDTFHLEGEQFIII